MIKTYIGIDNGVSGSIGIISDSEIIFLETPIKRNLNYQKTKAKNISRIDVIKLKDIFLTKTSMNNLKVLLERPMVNPTRFEATASALRALEATLIVLEDLDISYEYIDSKSWQKELLPSGIKGSDQQKKASMDVGCRMFPQWADLIKSHKDADGLLIAEWARRKNL